MRRRPSSQPSGFVQTPPAPPLCFRRQVGCQEGVQNPLHAPDHCFNTFYKEAAEAGAHRMEECGKSAFDYCVPAAARA